MAGPKSEWQQWPPPARPAQTRKVYLLEAPPFEVSEYRYQEGIAGTKGDVGITHRWFRLLELQTAPGLTAR